MLTVMAILVSAPAFAGHYAPAAGEEGSTAIWKGDPAIIGWATGWTNYNLGSGPYLDYTDPDLALGSVQTGAYDVVNLGRNGDLTLTFDTPIRDVPGYDFAVFENSFSDNYLELAYCEVSSDGEHFVRFESDSLTAALTESYIDPTDVDGLAGKYLQGYGTPFDLALLNDPQLDLQNIAYVRLVDVLGDGSNLDSSGDPIYDPYQDWLSNGFDLEAIAVIPEPHSLALILAGPVFILLDKVRRRCFRRE